MPQLTRPPEVRPDNWREVLCYYSCCGICCSLHRTGKCGLRPFLWVWVQGQSLHAPCMVKNTYGSVGIPLIRGTSGSGQLTQPPQGIKAWGDGPLRLEEISSCRDTLSQIRAAVNTAGRNASQQLERSAVLLQRQLHLPA